MTTLTELRKYAKSTGFESEMQEYNFIMGPSGLWFYRLRGDYIDFFEFWISSSKNWVTVPVTCLKKSIISHCDMSVFPKGFNVGIPIYTDSYINEEYGVEIGGEAWKIKTEQDIKNTFSEITNLFEKSVNKYFNNINTDTKLYDSLSLNIKESKLGQEFEVKLFGK